MHSIQDASKRTPVLTVQQLQIQHQQQLLVHNLNFELHAGETLALVGESGSGKSVSSLALLGLLPSQLQIQGQALFQGQDLLQLNPDSRPAHCHDFSGADDGIKSAASGRKNYWRKPAVTGAFQGGNPATRAAIAARCWHSPAGR